VSLNKKRTPITRGACQKTITRCFGPIAVELGLALKCVNEELYEIVAPSLTIHIRFGRPPYRDYDCQETCDVGLVPTAERKAQWEKARNEIGIPVIASFYGEACKGGYVSTQEEFDNQVDEWARLVSKYCCGLLSGVSGDYPRIRAHLDAIIEKSNEEIRDMLRHMPSNVKRMWRMEGEAESDWLARVKRGEESPMP